jgi:hypothetical protein
VHVVHVSSSSRAVYVHIGPAKTGTTYLQDVLWRNRARLAEQGLTFPGRGPVAHFHAALDLRDIRFGGHEDPRVAGAWDRLVAQVREAPAAAVVTHEILAGADDEQIARVGRDFAEHDIHVVYGARDLARQLPAVWQESLKNRRSRRFDAFLERALRPGAEEDAGPRGFWRAQDAAATLRRWAGIAHRVHVVTLPQSGAAPDTLWRRFAAALALDGDGFDLDVARSNASLSARDAELLRRLNRALPDDLEWPQYDRIVKRRFNRAANRGSDGPRVLVPRSLADDVRARAVATRDALAASDYDIVGELDDLIPPDSAFGEGPVERVDVPDDEVKALAAEVLAEAGRVEIKPARKARSLLRRFKSRRGAAHG